MNQRGVRKLLSLLLCVILFAGVMVRPDFTVLAEESGIESQLTEENPETAEQASDTQGALQPAASIGEDKDSYTAASEQDADSYSAGEDTESGLQQDEQQENTEETDGDQEEQNEEEELILFGASLDVDDPTSLSNYVKSLNVSVNGESKTADTEIYDGDELEVVLNWQIPGEVYKDNKTFYYQLPVTFQISAPITDNILQGSEVVGSFRVDTDGLVTLTYHDDYNQENNTTANSMGIKGKASYQPDASDDDVKLLYEDGEETIVVLNEGDFTVKKAGTKIYEDDKLSRNSVIAYTVEIESELGTRGDFSISDTLTTLGASGSAPGDFEAVSYDESSFQITDADGNPVTGWEKNVRETSSYNQVFFVENPRFLRLAYLSE